MERYKFQSREISECENYGDLPEEILLPFPFSRRVQSDIGIANLIWKFPYELKGDDVYLYVGEKKFVYTKEKVNMFFFALNYANGNVLEAYGRYCSVGLMSVKYDVFPKTIVEESGQAKILVGTLESVVELKDPKVNIIVIGSASYVHIVGGRSYDTLALYLSKLGYNGEMDLYDPHEKQSSMIVGNFKINRNSAYISNFKSMRMMNGSQPTVILDDAYNIDLGIEYVPDSVQKVKVDYREIREGDSKYVLYSASEGYGIISGLADHSKAEVILHSSYTNYDVLGGGHVKVEGATMKFYGDSNVYGPPDYNILSSVLLHEKYMSYDVRLYQGHAYRAHDSNLTIMNNPCRVSVKAVMGEKPLPGCEIRSQYYYSKRECRMVKDFPRILNYGLQIGDGCLSCMHLGKVLAGIRSFSGVNQYDAFKYLFAGHVKRTCFKEVGIQQAARIAMVREHAWKEVSYEYGVSSFKDTYKGSSEYDYKRLIKFVGASVGTRPISLISPKAKEYIARGKKVTFEGLTWVVNTKKGKKYVTEQFVSYNKSVVKYKTQSKLINSTVGDTLLLLNGGPFKVAIGDSYYDVVQRNGHGVIVYDDAANPPYDEQVLLCIPSKRDKYVNQEVWMPLLSISGKTIWKMKYRKLEIVVTSSPVIKGGELF